MCQSTFTYERIFFDRSNSGREPFDLFSDDTVLPAQDCFQISSTAAYYQNQNFHRVFDFITTSGAPAALTGRIKLLKTERPVLSVNTLQIDTAGYVIKDIKGNVKYPVTFREIALYLLIAIAVAAIIYLIIRYIRYRRANRDFFGRPIVQDPPHIVALRKLDKIRSEKLWQAGRQKQYYTGITDALREYIQKRYDMGAMEMTSAEILDGLKDKKIDEKIFGELDELLKTADLVKFAKFVPDAVSNEEAVPKAVRFVNSTFMQEMEQEKEVK